MIFNNNKVFAKVWKVNSSENGKYIDLQITTFEKKQNDEYVYSRWFPRVIGHAVNSLKNLQPEDRIVITKCKFTNETYEDSENNKKSRFRFLILEANIDSGEKNSTPAKATKKESAQPQTHDDCPW